MDHLKMEMEIPSVKASANSDIIFFFTSAQDGDPLQDDVRLCLGDDLKKAQDHRLFKDEITKTIEYCLLDVVVEFHRKTTLTIVDCGHDGAALSPEPKAGEILAPGRVTFGAASMNHNLEMNAHNGEHECEHYRYVFNLEIHNGYIISRLGEEVTKSCRISSNILKGILEFTSWYYVSFGVGILQVIEKASANRFVHGGTVVEGRRQFQHNGLHSLQTSYSSFQLRSTKQRTFPLNVPPCGWKHSVEVLDDSLRYHFMHWKFAKPVRELGNQFARRLWIEGLYIGTHLNLKRGVQVSFHR
ncbi:hypothetical protein Tco_1176775 [Tanacetum coccineum]